MQRNQISYPILHYSYKNHNLYIFRGSRTNFIHLYQFFKFGCVFFNNNLQIVNYFLVFFYITFVTFSVLHHNLPNMDSLLHHQVPPPCYPPTSNTLTGNGAVTSLLSTDMQLLSTQPGMDTLVELMKSLSTGCSTNGAPFTGDEYINQRSWNPAQGNCQFPSNYYFLVIYDIIHA